MRLQFLHSVKIATKKDNDEIIACHILLYIKYQVNNLKKQKILLNSSERWKLKHSYYLTAYHASHKPLLI